MTQPVDLDKVLDVPCAKCGEIIALPVREVIEAGGLGKVQHTVCPRDEGKARPQNRYRMEVRVFRATWRGGFDVTEGNWYEEPEPLVGTGAEAIEVAIGPALELLGKRLTDNWARMAENAALAETEIVAEEQQHAAAQVLADYDRLIVPGQQSVPTTQRLIVPGQ